MAETETLVQVAPEKILADDNSRFNLKKLRVDALATSILESGGVLTPIEVEPLAKPHNGAQYRLVSGFYRHAAVTKLNAEQGAGLTLPAIVRQLNDPTVRLRHQLAENMERENQSPMDKAVAIKKLLDAGVARGEVRRIFSAVGGRKGLAIQPLSNAMLNIHLRFLELPKAIQQKIHDGVVGVAAAYQLGKVPADKRADVLERAERERIAQIDAEERDEEKYLTAEKKLHEAQAKAEEATTELQAATEEENQTLALVQEKTQALREAQQAIPANAKAPDAKVAIERVKAAEVDVKAAEKLAKEVKAKLAKLQDKVKSSAEVAKEKAAVLDAARKAAKPGAKKPKAVGPEDVKKAAKDAGVEGAGQVALTASQMRECIAELALPGSYPTVALIGVVIKDCFDGGMTPKELYTELAVIVGEKTAVPSTVVRKATATKKAS